MDLRPAMAGVAIYRRFLVRILAIAKRPLPRPPDMQGWRQVRRAAVLVRRPAAPEPGRDRLVVRCGSPEGFPGKRPSRRHGQAAVSFGQFVRQGFVLRRRSDHPRKKVIFGRRANHGRPANVDILDGFGFRNVPGYDFFKGVQIRYDKFDGGNGKRLQGFHVLAVVAAGEQAAMHGGMQRFDAPVQYFGISRAFGHIDNGQTGFPQGARGAARRNQFDAVFAQALRKGNEACFVEYGEQGPAHGQDVGGRRQALGGNH